MAGLIVIEERELTGAEAALAEALKRLIQRYDLTTTADGAMHFIEALLREPLPDGETVHARLSKRWEAAPLEPDQEAFQALSRDFVRALDPIIKRPGTEARDPRPRRIRLRVLRSLWQFGDPRGGGRPSRYDAEIIMALVGRIEALTGREFSYAHDRDLNARQSTLPAKGEMLDVLRTAYDWFNVAVWRSIPCARGRPIEANSEGLLNIVKEARRSGNGQGFNPMPKL